MFELRVLNGLHQGAALPLFGEQWSLGAHADADLLLNDPGIAEHHAHLLLTDGCWSVQAEVGLLKDADGNVLAQISNLGLDTTFFIGSVRLCVSPADHPWPKESPTEPPFAEPLVQTQFALKLSSISSSQQKRLISVVLAFALLITGAGIIFSGEREAQASLMPAVLKKTELGSPFEVRQQLLKMLSERELTPRVSLQIVNGQISLGGDVSQEDVALVARMLDRFAEQFDTAVPVLSRVRERDGALPFKIVQIISGPNGSVVLEEGTRMFVGDEVDGLRLVLIDNSKVIFDGVQRYEVRW